jgi:hypothetical protein
VSQGERREKQNERETRPTRRVSQERRRKEKKNKTRLRSGRRVSQKREKHALGYEEYRLEPGIRV